MLQESSIPDMLNCILIHDSVSSVCALRLYRNGMNYQCSISSELGIGNQFASSLDTVHCPNLIYQKKNK